jgi:hypothetical protein
MDYEMIISVAVLVLLAIVIYMLYRFFKKKSILPYKKKYLLTKNEWAFYKKLKPVADRYGYNIIAKIRLADLVEVDTSQTKEYGKYFPKISSKHIDFGLVNPENMEVLYLIELDDRSHQRADRIERDKLVNALCEKVGYTLIRTYNDTEEVERVLSGRKK